MGASKVASSACIMSRLPPHLLHLVADADTVWPVEDAEKINSDGARVLWWSGCEVQFSGFYC